MPTWLHRDRAAAWQNHTASIREVQRLKTSQSRRHRSRIVRIRTGIAGSLPARRRRLRPAAAVRRAARRQAPSDRAVAPRLRQVDPAGMARQRRRHRSHLSRAAGYARPRQGRHRRLLDRRLDRRRDGDQGAGARSAPRHGRAGRRQGRLRPTSSTSPTSSRCRRRTCKSCSTTTPPGWRPTPAR